MGLSRDAPGLLQASGSNNSGSDPWPRATKSSSPAPSPARSTRRRCRRICRSPREEIADAAIGAAEAGAAIVHLHARNPKDGRPDQTPEAFPPFLKVIKQRSPVVINITTGGAPTMTVEERVRPAAHFKPEVASLNMGTMNFGALSDDPALQGQVQARLGAAVSRRVEEGHVQEHLRRHRVHPDHLRRQRHALRDRVLRHRSSLHAAAFPRSRPGQAAAVRAVACSASSAASARIPKTSCT